MVTDTIMVTGTATIMDMGDSMGSMEPEIAVKSVWERK